MSEYKDEPEALKFATYLTCYKNALAEENVENLEAAWKLCDSAWMDTKASIQIVHDIEDGYSDPLRAKQGPDFSLRFLDETYANQNSTTFIKHPPDPSQELRKTKNLEPSSSRGLQRARNLEP